MKMILVIPSLVFKDKRLKNIRIKVFAIHNLTRISKTIRRRKLKINWRRKKINIDKKSEKWKGKEAT